MKFWPTYEIFIGGSHFVSHGSPHWHLCLLFKQNNYQVTVLRNVKLCLTSSPRNMFGQKNIWLSESHLPIVVLLCFFIPIYGKWYYFIHKFAASFYKIFNCKFNIKNNMEKQKPYLFIKYIRFNFFFSLFFFFQLFYLIWFLYNCQLQIFQVLLFAIHITIHAVFIPTRKFYTQVINYTWTGSIDKNTCATTLQLHIYRKMCCT